MSEIIVVSIEDSFNNYGCGAVVYNVNLLQHYLCSSLIALLAVSVFLRVDFLLKLVVMIVTSLVHIILVSYVRRDFFAVYYSDFSQR